MVAAEGGEGGTPARQQGGRGGREEDRIGDDTVSQSAMSQSVGSYQMMHEHPRVFFT